MECLLGRRKTGETPRVIMDSLWLVLLSPVLAVMLVLMLIRPARRFGLVDHPGGRKQHAAVTPLVGGFAIFLTLLLVKGVAGGIPGGSWSLFAAMAITVAIGVADDMHEIGHRSKFFAQVMAALVLVSGTDTHVLCLGDLLGFGDIELGKWSYLVTVLAIIGLMNAINMIDGVDGLAGVVTLVPLLVFAVIAMSFENASLTVEILILAGAVVGFLALNLRSPWRSRALVFMGDTGGMLLGLLLAWFSVILAGTNNSPIHPITAVWILAVPLWDMGSVMVLRMLQHKSPFFADRQHMHYVLLDGGYSVSQVVATKATISLVIGLIAVWAERVGIPEFLLFFVFLIVWATYTYALARPDRTLVLLQRIMQPRVVVAMTTRGFGA
jgi:UDP-GlcNAc:undecaprenyl-phosphate/decaprenyl-phosphate GlcNAc-1-phosphate transferase